MRRFQQNSFLFASLLLLPAALLLLTTLACLPLPIGDPEKAVVDKDLVGAWELVTDPAKADDHVIVTMRPLDPRTYFTQYIELPKKNDGSRKVQNFRSWLVTLDNKTYICMETLDDEKSLNLGEKNDLFYVIALISKEGEKLTFRMVNGDSKLLKENTDNPDLLSKDAATFRKLGKDDLELLQKARKPQPPQTPATPNLP